MKWETRFKPQFFITLMVFIVLSLGFSQNFTAEVQADYIETSRTTNLLIYKDFGEEPYTGFLPEPCTENCDQDSTPYSKPDVNPTPYVRSELEEITTTGMWPYTPTVKIFSHWPSGDITTCSGMLVQALTLVTAGQCVYTHQADLCPVGQDSCWVDDLEAIPSYADGEDRFGKSGYQTILTWTAWTEAENSEYDLAAVQLRYPLGASLGWLGVGFSTDDSYFLNNDFSTTSYPHATPFNGETMAEWTGPFSEAQTDLLYIDGTSDSGQIGASINGADGVAYGILSNPNAGEETIVTRITYEKFTAIHEFIELGLPKTDLDLAVFDVHATPLWSFPGQLLNHLDFLIHNYSNVGLPEDTYSFDVYLSEDEIISDADDTWLGVVTFTGEIPANTGLRLTFSSEAGLALPAVIHGDQPNGDIFYVGVVSTLGDINESNNRSEYFQPEPIWVNDSDNRIYLFPIVICY